MIFSCTHKNSQNLFSAAKFKQETAKDGMAKIVLDQLQQNESLRINLFHLNSQIEEITQYVKYILQTNDKQFNIINDKLQKKNSSQITNQIRFIIEELISNNTLSKKQIQQWKSNVKDQQMTHFDRNMQIKLLQLEQQLKILKNKRNQDLHLIYQIQSQNVNLNKQIQQIKQQKLCLSNEITKLTMMLKNYSIDREQLQQRQYKTQKLLFQAKKKATQNEKKYNIIQQLNKKILFLTGQNSKIQKKNQSFKQENQKLIKNHKSCLIQQNQLRYIIKILQNKIINITELKNQSQISNNQIFNRIEQNSFFNQDNSNNAQNNNFFLKKFDLNSFQHKVSLKNLHQKKSSY